MISHSDPTCPSIEDSHSPRQQKMGKPQQSFVGCPGANVKKDTDLLEIFYVRSKDCGSWGGDRWRLDCWSRQQQLPKETSCGESGTRNSRSGTRKSRGSRSGGTYCATAACGAITPEAAQRGGRSDDDGGRRAKPWLAPAATPNESSQNGQEVLVSRNVGDWECQRSWGLLLELNS